MNVYLQTLFRSMWIAARVTIFSLLLGYPLAYYLSFYAGKRKDLLYQLVIIPLWVSYLVRAYAWKTILGSDGVLNTLLQYVHLTSHPLDFLLYSPFAVVLTLTHIYTPFTFLPIYAALEHIPRNLVEASHDLGASPFQTFWRVIFPLSIPGVLAGATFAFVLSLGDFLAPLLLGGPSGIMISNIVVSLFGAAYNWPLGRSHFFLHAGAGARTCSFSRKVWRRNGASDESRRAHCAHFALAALARALSSSVFSICPSLRSLCIRSMVRALADFRRAILTLNWYRLLFADDAIWTSVLNSLLVAFAAMAISLTFGIPAALALDRANFPGKALFRRLVLLPLILPGIITGLSLLMLFRAADVKLSLLTIILGHGTALISVATTEVFAGLQKLDRAQEEASLDLGANYWQTFWRVTLPNLRLSIIGAALLIFTLSMDEIAVSFFLIGRDNTLPLEIWGRLRRGITPEINAISTIIFVFSLAAIVTWYRLRAKG